MSMKQERLDFARYRELISILQWIETHAPPLHSTKGRIGFKDFILRRIISLDEKYFFHDMTFDGSEEE